MCLNHTYTQIFVAHVVDNKFVKHAPLQYRSVSEACVLVQIAQRIQLSIQKCRHL